MNGCVVSESFSARFENSFLVLTPRMTVSSFSPAWLSLAGALLTTGLLVGDASPSSDVPAESFSLDTSRQALNQDRPSTDRSDTLDAAVNAGSPLILSLPSSVRGQPVEQYRLVKPPPLASVADRSLLWVTRPSDSGSHILRIIARHADPPADTLIVRVDVRDRS